MSLFSIINIIYFRLRNRLLYKRVNKLEFISINTRTRVRGERELETKITEKEKADDKDRLLLYYDMNKAVEEMIKAEKCQKLELLAELDEFTS